jgi:hypothetical protein
MIKNYLFLFIFIYFGLLCRGQVWQSTYGPGNGVSFAMLLDGKIFSNQYISTDGGNSFHSYAGSLNFTKIIKHQGEYYGITGSGLYKSMDGEIWTQRSTLTISKLYSDSINLFISGEGVKMSTDNGFTWTIICDTTVGVSDFFVFGSEYIIMTTDGLYSREKTSSIWVRRTFMYFNSSATAGNKIIYELNNKINTIDTTSWTVEETMNGIPAISDIHVYNFFKDGNTIYASTVSGTYYADQNTLNWQLLTSQHSGFIHVKSPYIVMSSQGSIYLSNNMGSSFSLKNSGMIGGTTLTDCSANDNYIFVNDDHNLYRKPINNNQWEQLKAYGFSHSGVSAFGDTIVTYVDNNIWFSYDTGNTWSVHSFGFSGIPTAKVIKHKNKYFLTNGIDIFWSDFNPISWHRLSGHYGGFELLSNDSLLIANSSYQIRTSIDCGITWSSIFSKSHNRALGMSNDYLVTTSNDSIYISSDFYNWTATGNTPFTDAEKLIIKDSMVYMYGFDYVGWGGHNNRGLFKLNLNDMSIVPFYNGLSDSATWPFNQKMNLIYEHNNILYASTGNSGLFEITAETVSGIQEIRTITGLSIYPNPTSGFLYVNYTCPSDKITLIVYEINGQMIKKIDDLNNTCVIDCSSLNAGVYILKVQSEKETFVRKFIKENK